MSQKDVRSAIDTTHAKILVIAKTCLVSVISTSQTTVSNCKSTCSHITLRLTNLVAKLPEHERGYWEAIVLQPSEYCAIFSDDLHRRWWRMANLFYMPGCRIFAIAMIPRWRPFFISWGMCIARMVFKRCEEKALRYQRQNISHLSLWHTVQWVIKVAGICLFDESIQNAVRKLAIEELLNIDCNISLSHVPSSIVESTITYERWVWCEMWFVVATNTMLSRVSDPRRRFRRQDSVSSSSLLPKPLRQSHCAVQPHQTSHQYLPKRQHPHWCAVVAILNASHSFYRIVFKPT
jgi:hypothetical protein